MYSKLRLHPHPLLFVTENPAGDFARDDIFEVIPILSPIHNARTRIIFRNTLEGGVRTSVLTLEGLNDRELRQEEIPDATAQPPFQEIQLYIFLTPSSSSPVLRS